jgi:hypothetical protein
MKTTKILLVILLVITVCRTKEIFDKEINGIITGKQKFSGVIQVIGQAFEAFEKETLTDLVGHFIDDQLATGSLKYFSGANADKAIEKIFYLVLDGMIRENESVFIGKNKAIIEIWGLPFKLYTVTNVKISCHN